MFDLMFSNLLLKNEANSSHDLLESRSEDSLEGGSVSFQPSGIMYGYYLCCCLLDLRNKIAWPYIPQNCICGDSLYGSVG